MQNCLFTYFYHIFRVIFSDIAMGFFFRNCITGMQGVPRLKSEYYACGGGNSNNANGMYLLENPFNNKKTNCKNYPLYYE